jgi:hypothetical protein
LIEEEEPCANAASVVLVLNTGILDESVERPREQELGSDAVVRSNFIVATRWSRLDHMLAFLAE